MVFQDDQSEVLNLLLLKLTFLWLEKQPPLSEGSKDLVDNLLVFREGVGVNEDVIHVADYLAIVDKLSQLATGCVTCHTCHGCVTHFRPILGNIVEVTLVTFPILFIVSHTKRTSFP